MIPGYFKTHSNEPGRINESMILRAIVREAPRLSLNLISVGIFIFIWRYITHYGWVSPLFLPSPEKVLSAGTTLLAGGELWQAIAASSIRVFAGFLIAAVVAIPLGIVMGASKIAYGLGAPFISILRPLPSIAWVPLTMLWMGIGESQKIAIVFLGSWIYILLATVEATKQVDPILIRAARNLGAKSSTVMWEVVLPSAVPGIMAGLKMTLAISWACVLSAELIAAQSGLGAMIWMAKEWGNLPLVLVGMVSISLVVLVADILIVQLEYLLFPWMRSRGTAARN
jgi:taurine transport system permease protein